MKRSKKAMRWRIFVADPKDTEDRQIGIALTEQEARRRVRRSNAVAVALEGPRAPLYYAVYEAGRPGTRRKEHGGS